MIKDIKISSLVFASIILLSILIPNNCRAQPSYEGQWFSDDSPWNVPVGDAAETDYSATAVQAFLDDKAHLNMNVWNKGTPAIIYGDSSKDKTQNIVFEDGLGHPWTLKNVPIPKRLIDYALYRVKHEDVDGMMALYDEAKKGFYSFWIPNYENDVFSIRFGGFSPIDGPGWSIHATHSPVHPLDTPSLGRMCGANYAGGLIRKSEIEAGEIKHALAIMWPKHLVRGYDALNWRVFPANSTDGSATDEAIAVPSGARIQLDPELTEIELRDMGLNDVDIIVAKAMQKYGGYIVDTMFNFGAVYFENMMTSPQSSSIKATSPWPDEVYQHLRFVDPPPIVALDNAAIVGTPVP